MARKKPEAARSTRRENARRRVEALAARRLSAGIKGGARDDRPTEEVAFYYGKIAFGRALELRA